MAQAPEKQQTLYLEFECLCAKTSKFCFFLLDVPNQRQLLRMANPSPVNTPRFQAVVVASEDEPSLMIYTYILSLSLVLGTHPTQHTAMHGAICLRAQHLGARGKRTKDAHPASAL